MPVSLIVLILFIFAFGAIIGSFLNVVILRAFSGESIVLPPSKCPKCHNKLKWWHNIPILSYLLLRGKCWFCKEKISIQYPIIEFITGLIFVAIFFKYGLRIESLFAAAIASLLIVISVTDIKERVVFDFHTYSLVGVGLIYGFYLTALQVISAHNSLYGFSVTTDWLIHNPLTSSLLGIIAGVIIMEIAARIGYLVAGTRAFGEGDTYIAAGLGAVFGLMDVLVILALSVAIQLLFTLPVFIKKLVVKKEYSVLISLVAFFVYAGIFYVIQSRIEIFALLLTCAVILGLLGMYTCWRIIEGLKNPDEMTYLPFGPAMAIAGLIMLLI